MDTETGALARAFPSTKWSRILKAPAGDASASELRRESLEALATAYWKPVYAYVRARWARTDEEAKDDTQAFFLWMLESSFLEAASPERGRFRGYIKRALENFLTDIERRRSTLKRGGGHRFVSVHGDADELGALELIDSTEEDPGDVLDRLWRSELLERGARALEEELRVNGRQVVFDVFRDYFLSDSEVDYVAVAERYGIKLSDVSNHLAYAKKRYRLHLRRAVMETVRGRAELEEELRWLFGEDTQ